MLYILDGARVYYSFNVVLALTPLTVSMKKPSSSLLIHFPSRCREVIFCQPTATTYHITALPSTPRKMSCPSLSFLMRSSKNCLWRFAVPGSVAMVSTCASDKPLTTTGEKIFSRPRMRWRSTTCVVTFATKVFCWTCSICWLAVAKDSMQLINKPYR